VHGAQWKRVKKRRLNVPNIAFLDTGILFDILGYSRVDCLHVSFFIEGTALRELEAISAPAFWTIQSIKDPSIAQNETLDH